MYICIPPQGASLPFGVTFWKVVRPTMSPIWTGDRAVQTFTRPFVQMARIACDRTWGQPAMNAPKAAGCCGQVPSIGHVITPPLAHGGNGYCQVILGILFMKPKLVFVAFLMLTAGLSRGIAFYPCLAWNQHSLRTTVSHMNLPIHPFSDTFFWMALPFWG